MSIYVQVLEALQDLAGGRIFPVVAEEGVETPYIVVQRVGGSPMNFLSGEAPIKQPHRVQVSVWAANALEAEEVGGQVQAAMQLAVHLQPEVLTGPVDAYDETTTYRGARQDFSIFC